MKASRILNKEELERTLIEFNVRTHLQIGSEAHWPKRARKQEIQVVCEGRNSHIHPIPNVHTLNFVCGVFVGMRTTHHLTSLAQTCHFDLLVVL